MQIVIEISDYDKEWITNGVYIPDEINRKIAEAIINGIPLPEHHGRLIDADELFLDIQTDEQMRLGEHIAWVRERIEDAPTIIEADKGEENDD